MFKKKYKSLPYLIISTNVTIEAVIRHYNDLNMDREDLKFLVNIFNELNPEARPPVLGRKVIVPILEQYWEKHKQLAEL